MSDPFLFPPSFPSPKKKKIKEKRKERKKNEGRWLAPSTKLE
jgi:hypothetical protein